MKNIRVAIIGIGNCAKSLIQTIASSRLNDDGIIRNDIGGYKPQNIDIVAAFDIDQRKVGQKLSDAIYAKPNCAIDLVEKNVVDEYATVIVQKGPLYDGVSEHMEFYPEDDRFLIDTEIEPVDIVSILKEREVDILINYLPVGSEEATKFYAQCAIDAKVAFLNCIPVFIASNPEWEQKFIDAGLPLIGDDMKSQFGASILSQMLQELAFARGHRVKCHIQENVGGNTDFLNMMNQSRLKSKKISKENVIRSQNDIYNIDTQSFLYAGPSNYIKYYGDNKICNIHMEMEGLHGSPVVFDCRLSVQDSPNSAGVVIEAIRYLKVAREMNIVGALRGASAFTQKTPPEAMTFNDSVFECDELANRHYTNLTKLQINSR